MKRIIYKAKQKIKGHQLERENQFDHTVKMGFLWKTRKMMTLCWKTILKENVGTGGEEIWIGIVKIQTAYKMKKMLIEPWDANTLSIWRDINNTLMWIDIILQDNFFF